MVRFTNAQLLVSLACALAPIAIACGGGADGGAAAGDPNDMTIGMGGAAEADDSGMPKAGKSSSSAGSSNQQPEMPGAGGVAGEPEPEPQPEPEPVGDTEAPSIVATSPADGATGVTAETLLEVEFSEPMDPESVEAAYASSELLKNRVEFGWNEDHTKVTIKPLDMLAYNQGEGDDTPALEYVITIGSTATDAAGNPMGEDASWSFSTLREIIINLPADAALSGYVNLTAKTHAATIQAGDNVANDTHRGLLTFDLSPVPDGLDLTSAMVVARQQAATNVPFTDLSANEEAAQLVLWGRTFASRVDAAGPGFPGKVLGLFSNSPQAGARSLSVLGQVQAQLADRETYLNKSQYVLQFPLLTDNKSDIDKVTFIEAVLSLSYLTP